MSTTASLTGTEVEKILKQCGFVHLRNGRRHRLYIHRATNTVIGLGDRKADVPRGVMRKIARAAGCTLRELEARGR